MSETDSARDVRPSLKSRAGEGPAAVEELLRAGHDGKGGDPAKTFAGDNRPESTAKPTTSYLMFLIYGV